MAQRGIGVRQIAETLAQPDRTEADRHDPEIRRAVRRFGAQILRVVYNHITRPPNIVTAFFDRRLRRKP
jgi:hypothetical protein